VLIFGHSHATILWHIFFFFSSCFPPFNSFTGVFRQKTCWETKETCGILMTLRPHFVPRLVSIALNKKRQRWCVLDNTVSR
jgi:hypothetical protein